jgi:hypothetical protein
VVLLCYVKFNAVVPPASSLYTLGREEKIVGAVGVVDWWKKLVPGHTEGQIAL